MTSQRKRGRPKGSCIDDMPVMKDMADLMVSEPGMKPTTAFRRLTKSRNPSERRRIQMKWRLVGLKLLAEAEARRAHAIGPSVASTELALIRAARQAAQAQEHMRIALGLDNPFYSVFDDWKKNSATIEAALEVGRLARQAFDSPAVKLAREFHDSPAARLAREIYDSPSARLAREMYNSPEMRLMREMRNTLPSWPK